MKYILILMCAAMMLPACARPQSGASTRSPQAMEYNRAAATLMRRGEFDDAKQYIDMALRLDPLYYDANISLLKYHIGKKDFPGAIAAGERMIRLSPGDQELCVTLAVLHEKTGAPEKAAGWYEKGLALYDEKIRNTPADEGLRFNRAFLYRLMGRENEARAELERFVTAYPDNKRLPLLIKMNKTEYIEDFLRIE